MVSRFFRPRSVFSRRRLTTAVNDEYDLLVVGGGSGGLACAKEASKFTSRVAVLDYVKPSLRGSKWGLGGTCVNVGCIPKKLMHHAALIGQSFKDANAYGWTNQVGSVSMDWKKLTTSVQNHIRSLNWGHRIQLNDKKIKYINGYGSFIDAQTVRVVGDKSESVIRSKYVVLATGLRPKYPEIPGSNEGITSDDLFSLSKPPGRTLVVGGSYVAIECAGLLSSLTYPTTIMVRSVPLRGFDGEMAEMTLSNLEYHKIRILRKCVPEKVARHDDGLLVSWKENNGSVHQDKFDTVLWAIGREPRMGSMNVEKAGIKCHSNSGKVVVDETDRSSVPNIYAIGDIQHGRPELTPVAIRAGKLLARRLFNGGTELMNYDAVASTVFAPVEYSFVGMSEEVAVQKFGADALEVYHAHFLPLEFKLPGRELETCYIKVISIRSAPESVVGIHYLGPNAGEVMQGFSVALQCGLTTQHLFSTVGIHPTNAEEMVKLNITKRSGNSAVVTSC